MNNNSSINDTPWHVNGHVPTEGAAHARSLTFLETCLRGIMALPVEKSS